MNPDRWLSKHSAGWREAQEADGKEKKLMFEKTLVYLEIMAAESVIRKHSGVKSTHLAVAALLQV